MILFCLSTGQSSCKNTKNNPRGWLHTPRGRVYPLYAFRRRGQSLPFWNDHTLRSKKPPLFNGWSKGQFVVSRMYCFGCNNAVLLSIMHEAKKNRPTLICYICNMVICDKCVEAAFYIEQCVVDQAVAGYWLYTFSSCFSLPRCGWCQGLHKRKTHRGQYRALAKKPLFNGDLNM